MSYLSPENLNDGQSSGNALSPGQKANIVLVAYEKIVRKSDQKSFPKHTATNADTGENYEFVGFGFHDAFKKLFPANASQADIDALIVPEVTVLEVECFEGKNPKFNEYSLKIVGTPAAKAGGPGF